MAQGADKPRSASARGKSNQEDDVQYIDGAVAITADPREKTPGAAQDQHQYIAGTRLDCPIQNVSVRGISFQRFTGGRPVFEESGGNAADGSKQTVSVNDARKVGAARWGSLVTLTKDQVAEIARDVGNKVIDVARDRAGNAVRGRIKSRNSPSFKHSPNHEPLGRYLYLVRSDAARGEMLETGDFPPMLAT